MRLRGADILVRNDSDAGGAAEPESNSGSESESGLSASESESEAPAAAAGGRPRARAGPVAAGRGGAGPPAAAGAAASAAARARPGPQRPESVTCPERNEYTQWTPHKLAEFIGDNFPEEIRVAKERVGDAWKWTPRALNQILCENLVEDKNGNHLRTFEVIEFENKIWEGIMRARCGKYRGRLVQVNGMLCWLC
jgi:hypothetical protein